MLDFIYIGENLNIEEMRQIKYTWEIEMRPINLFYLLSNIVQEQGILSKVNMGLAEKYS